LSTNGTILLEGVGLKKNYGPTQVLRGVDIVIPEGKMVALVGSSGAGKTTLLQLLGTLDDPTEGYVSYLGQRLTGLGDKPLSKFRNTQLGFVFQFHHLLAEFNALENVCIPGMIQGKRIRELRPRAEELLGLLNLSHRLKHHPSELSGGEQQRVAIARALLNRPRLILADEPTGNLDSKNGESLMRVLRDLCDAQGVGIVLATHNETFAQIADRIVRVADGYIAEITDLSKAAPTPPEADVSASTALPE
jgi:lipoprotein-releasing system ATP-binding protein